MDPMKQQNQDAITLAALQQTIESGSREIENLSKGCAEMCLSIKNKIDKHHQHVGHMLETLNKYNSTLLSSEFKNQLQDLFSTVNEFYDQEYMKCCHRVSNNCFEETSFNGAYDDDISLSVEDLLDRRIEELETKISSKPHPHTTI